MVSKVPAASKRSSLQLPNIQEPLQNMRELIKQMLCLEDHLSCTERQCEDCIRKHMLMAEGLADEGCALDTEGKMCDTFEKVAADLHRMELAFFGTPEGPKRAQQARAIKAQLRAHRKYLVRTYGSDWVDMYKKTKST
jgi:hypothetical protein